jgi:hypothetical protein
MTRASVCPAPGRSNSEGFPESQTMHAFRERERWLGKMRGICKYQLTRVASEDRSGREEESRRRGERNREASRNSGSGAGGESRLGDKIYVAPCGQPAHLLRSPNSMTHLF